MATVIESCRVVSSILRFLPNYSFQNTESIIQGFDFTVVKLNSDYTQGNRLRKGCGGFKIMLTYP